MVAQFDVYGLCLCDTCNIGGLKGKWVGGWMVFCLA